VFSVSCARRSRPPISVPGVLDYPDRVFSVSCAGRSRFPVRDCGVFGDKRPCYSEAYISGSTTGLTNRNNPSSSRPNLESCPLPAPSSSCRSAARIAL